jgi:ribosomal protein L7/L12
MDAITFLSTLNRLDHTMSLDTALSILDEAQKFSQPVVANYTNMDKYALAALVRDEVRFSAARTFLSENKKIQAIKEIRNIFGIGLREAKDVADHIASEYYTRTMPYVDSRYDNPPF